MSHDAATGRFALTLNNPDLDTVDVTVTSARRTVDGKYRFGAAIPGDRSLLTDLSALDYTAYGDWLISRHPGQGTYEWTHGGAFLGGFVTPAGAVPTSGTATFTGSVSGQYDESGQSLGDVGGLLGDVQVTANFASRELSGLMSNLSLGSEWVRHGPLNDIAFDARFDPTANMFSGATRVTNRPGGLTAFAENAAGMINGFFFGPGANEVGAVWTLSDDSHRMIGSFGAKRQ